MTSDFHHSLPGDVPPCDLLIVTGDVLGERLLGQTYSRANPPWLVKLEEWLGRQPAREIVGIAGNHDFVAETDPSILTELPWTYLHDSGTVVDGFRVWGSPWAVQFGSWAFMLPDDELAEKWSLIPDDTQILITHGPAHRILDRVARGEYVGSKTLRSRLDELPDLRLLVTGHIHEAYGKTGFARRLRGNGPSWTVAVNGSYAGWGKKHPPIVINV